MLPSQEVRLPHRILTVFAEKHRVPICKRLCAQLHLRVAPREIGQVPLCDEFTGARAAPAKVAEPEGDALELPHAGLHFLTRRWTIRASRLANKSITGAAKAEMTVLLISKSTAGRTTSLHAEQCSSVFNLVALGPLKSCCASCNFGATLW